MNLLYQQNERLSTGETTYFTCHYSIIYDILIKHTKGKSKHFFNLNKKLGDK